MCCRADVAGVVPMLACVTVVADTAHPTLFRASVAFRQAAAGVCRVQALHAASILCNDATLLRDVTRRCTEAAARHGVHV
jgi:hypothetical protein